MEVVANGGFNDRRRRKLSNGHVVAQLLEAPLPTPRRSCCGPAADAPAAPRRASAADAASPQRRHVPFSWETSPGVPKNDVAVGGNKVHAVLPPKPPPGRCGPGAGAPCSRGACHENTTDDASSDDDGDGDTFSDALDRISSSDRLAALSARLSAIDGAAGSRRSPSFIMDRFLPAANAIATTSADKRPRRRSSPRRGVRRSRSRSSKDDDDEEEAAARARARSALARDHAKPCPPRRSKGDAAAGAAQAPRRPPRVNEEEEQGDETSSPARACGLMFFFPWRAKPVLLSFPLTAARSSSRKSNASVASVTAPSPPRRSVTLGDILEKERKLHNGGDVSSRWHEERSGSVKGDKDGSASLRWGTALLGTSKRYCADAARKALGRLTRSATDGGDGPRLRRDRSSGKQGAFAMRSVSGKMPPLSPPSESWLSRARRGNATSNKR